MVKSKLSEQEIVEVGGFVAAQDLSGIVTYFNQLLYRKGLGTDGCSRPLALRATKDMVDPCFGRGYLNKVLEFIAESRKRMEDTDAIEKTVEYVEALINEVNQFFYVVKGATHG